MNCKISFEESNKIGTKILKKQQLVTYEQAIAQVKWLKENSKVQNSKKKK